MAKRIMSVDDSASIRQMVNFTLTGAGYEVVEAEDGQDALDKLAKSSVDMVITDLNMPRLDGIGLIKAVRADQALKFLPMILLTTESHTDKKELGRQAGATGWIVKPFKPDQLLAVIKRVLG